MAQEMMQNDPVLHLLVGETVSDRTPCGLNPSCWHFIEGGKKNLSQVGLRVSKI